MTSTTMTTDASSTAQYSSLSQSEREEEPPRSLSPLPPSRQNVAMIVLSSLVMLVIGGVLATVLAIPKEVGVSHSTTTMMMNPADGIPRVFFARGCSGSSAVGDTLRDVILPALGYPVFSKPQNEFMKPVKNYKFQEIRPLISTAIPDDVVLMEAFKFANQEALVRNETLLFKANVALTNLNEPLRDQMNARFAFLERENLVDHLSCWIKDCFFTHTYDNRDDKHGYPVFANNGTQTELCFNRRYHPEVEIMVYMNPDEVIPYIQERLQDNQQRHEMYQKLGPHVSKVQTMEDLFALEFTDDEDSFQLSVNAWTEFTSTFVIDEPEGGSTDEETSRKQQHREAIAAALLPMRNTRHPYGPHRDTIYNFDEVQKALAGTEYEKWLRY